jgi:hypothetical protein
VSYEGISQVCIPYISYRHKAVQLCPSMHPEITLKVAIQIGDSAGQRWTFNDEACWP